MPPGLPKQARPSSISAASSTRPGSDAVGEQDELERVLPVIEGLKGLPRRASPSIRARPRWRRLPRDKVPRSSTTSQPLPTIAKVSASRQRPGMSVVLMHAQGEPKTMQDNPTYDDVVLEVFDYLAGRIEAAEAAGIARAASPRTPASASARPWRTPRAARQSQPFHGLGVPLLIGASRKRFIKGIGRGRGAARRGSRARRRRPSLAPRRARRCSGCMTWRARPRPSRSGAPACSALKIKGNLAIPTRRLV